jgi:hypothetical protein
MKRTSLVLAALLLAVLACGAPTTPQVIATVAPTTDSGSQAQPTEAQPTEAPAAPVQQDYKVGDVISIGKNVLVVLGWENVPGTDFSKPDDGKKFVAVEVLLVNKSDSPVSVSTILQMSLKDDTGQKYDVDFKASMATDQSSVDGELSPGERVRGKVGYQVAENAQGLQFVFDASVFGTGKVFIDLGAEPVTLEPPAELAGETEQQAYKVGDVIAMGDTTITVNEITYPAGDQYTKPDAGKKFLIVDLTIENKSTAAINVSTLLQMSLKDPTGQKYTVDFMAALASGGTSPDGEIAPGEKLRGQVGFQVPENAAGLVFIFDAEVWGTGKVFVALP